MATKKDTAEKAETKVEKKEPAKKVTKTAKPKAAEKKNAPEQPKEEAVEKSETIIPEDVPKVPAIIDDTDKILKSSDVELPPDDPVGKQRIVVSHSKASVADDKIEVISAEEVLKDIEYDFDTREFKPYKGGAMTSHDMHQGKYGIIPDVTKEKKKK